MRFVRQKLIRNRGVVIQQVLPELGRVEKGLEKVRGKPFLSASQMEIGQLACCASQAQSSGR